MTHATEIVGYTYKADNYTPAGLLARMAPDAAAVSPHTVEIYLDALAALSGIDRDDEWSFDSGGFPKVIFASQVADETFCNEHGEYVSPWEV